METHAVDYILFGGMNFLLNHLPELTFDVDLWVADEEANLARLNSALRQLGAEWGKTEADWSAVAPDYRWLTRQTVFCLTSPAGAIDIFREVKGLEGRYAECKSSALRRFTASGVSYTSLSDTHMLACQLALPPHERKEGRIDVLRRALANNPKS